MSKAIPIIMSDMYINIKNKTEKSATEDDITVRITVGEVENGFIVTKNISGRRPVKPGTSTNSEDGMEWFDEGKSYITTKNPLEGEGDPEVIKLPNVKGLLDEYNSGKISV